MQREQVHNGHSSTEGQLSTETKTDFTLQVVLLLYTNRELHHGSCARHSRGTAQAKARHTGWSPKAQGATFPVELAWHHRRDASRVVDTHRST